MTSSIRSTILEIKAEYADADGWPLTTPIALPRVLAWMGSDDLEVLGVLYGLLIRQSCRERIQPPLNFAAEYAFMTGYYRRCLCEFAEETWEDRTEALTAGEAADGVANWFYFLWQDKTVPRPVLRQLKEWLAETMRDCPESRGLVEAALFDHLLLQRRFRKFFADWTDDPQLRRLMEW